MGTQATRAEKRATCRGRGRTESGESPVGMGALFTGIAAGAAGGLAGALVMGQIHKLFDAGKEAVKQQLSSPGEDSLFDDAGPRPEGDEEEPATAKAATAVANAAGYELDEEEKKVGGLVAHYGFGVAMGALYGGLATVAPAARAGHGTAAGALLWLSADEIAVPALGLSKPPQKHPVSKHTEALVNHLAFGAVVETVRMLTVRALGRGR